MTKKERFEKYKENLLAKLLQLKNAYDELNEFFDREEEFDCNDFICDDYPFDKSFNELAIADWTYTIEDKLNEYEKKLEGDNK